MKDRQRRDDWNHSRTGFFGITLLGAVAVIFLFGLAIGDFAEAGMVVYPAKGQSAEQQQKDEFECHQWAVQQTGYDPTRAPQAPQQQTTQKGQPVEHWSERGSALFPVRPVGGWPLVQGLARLPVEQNEDSNSNNKLR
jgi:hypothetical protein